MHIGYGTGNGVYPFFFTGDSRVNQAEEAGNRQDSVYFLDCFYHRMSVLLIEED
jgi:hypothetical protein